MKNKDFLDINGTCLIRYDQITQAKPLHSDRPINNVNTVLTLEDHTEIRIPESIMSYGEIADKILKKIREKGGVIK